MSKMTQLTINIPKDSLERILGAASGLNGYRENFDDGAGTTFQNPESKLDFTKRMLIGVLKEWVKQWEVERLINLT